jgi:hypothetical protein
MPNTHIHNIKIKSGNTTSIKEQIFRLKKIYSYLPRKNSFVSDTRSRKLISIGFICLYCSEITSFTQDYLDYKKHLQDQA